MRKKLLSNKILKLQKHRWNKGRGGGMDKKGAGVGWGINVRNRTSTQLLLNDLLKGGPFESLLFWALSEKPTKPSPSSRTMTTSPILFLSFSLYFILYTMGPTSVHCQLTPTCVSLKFLGTTL